MSGEGCCERNPLGHFGQGVADFVPIQTAASFVHKKTELCSYAPRHSRTEKCALVVLFGRVSVSVSSRFGG